MSGWDEAFALLLAGRVLLEDDPDAGFYGPPNEAGEQLRWSRAWFDWRVGLTPTSAS